MLALEEPRIEELMESNLLYDSTATSFPHRREAPIKTRLSLWGLLNSVGSIGHVYRTGGKVTWDVQVALGRSSALQV